MFFVVQAEGGIRGLVRLRGLGDGYKRQEQGRIQAALGGGSLRRAEEGRDRHSLPQFDLDDDCLLYTSDAADERSSVDLGGRRLIKKKNMSL